MECQVCNIGCGWSREKWGVWGAGCGRAGVGSDIWGVGCGVPGVEHLVREVRRRLWGAYCMV